MPVQAISPGPVWPIIGNIVYALPGSACEIISPAQLQRSNLYAGPFVNWAGGYNHVGGFVKSVVDTTIQAIKVKMDGSAYPPGSNVPIRDDSGAYSAAILKDKPSYYWSLNEESGLIAADSVGGAHGTISGGVTLGQSGIGKSMLFDGSGQITSSIVTIPTISTIEFWMKSTSLTSYRAPFSCRIATNGFLIGNNATALICYSDNSTPVEVGWAAALVENVWQHIVAVRSATLIKFYVNGVASSQIAQTHGPVTTTIKLSDVVNATGYNGSIDEVAIYPRALSASEIQSHYLAKFGITNPTSYAAKVVMSGPSNYWRLNETSGTTAVDIVGGANGTISGGVTLNGESGMTFDGTSGKISLGSPSITALLTVEAWIKTSVSGYGTIISNRQSTPVAGNFYFGTQTSGGALVILAFGFAVIGTKNVCDNQWHHVVYVQTGTNSITYVDGIQEAILASSGAANSIPASIGQDPQTSGSFFNGSIDEVAIYPRALTPAEILSHFQARNS